jgi:hypothetical protein
VHDHKDQHNKGNDKGADEPHAGFFKCQNKNLDAENEAYNKANKDEDAAHDIL